MMSQADFSISFQRHTLETVAFTLKYVPSKSVQKTQYQIWTRKCPILSFMKIQDYKAYVKHQASNKLGRKLDKCYFMGYPKESKGYYFYNPIKGKVFVTQIAYFQKENSFLEKTSERKI